MTKNIEPYEGTNPKMKKYAQELKKAYLQGKEDGFGEAVSAIVHMTDDWNYMNERRRKTYKKKLKEIKLKKIMEFNQKEYENRIKLQKEN